MEKTKSFEDLKVWQLARDLKKEIYAIIKEFPKKEDYYLSAQIRDAAISITANIAEGGGRYHYQEEIQFCRIARGSLNEVIDHLYTALDAEYITKDRFTNLYNKARETEKVLNGYLSYLKNIAKK